MEITHTIEHQEPAIAPAATLERVRELECVISDLRAECKELRDALKRRGESGGTFCEKCQGFGELRGETCPSCCPAPPGGEQGAPA